MCGFSIGSPCQVIRRLVSFDRFVLSTRGSPEAELYASARRQA